MLSGFGIHCFFNAFLGLEDVRASKTCKNAANSVALMGISLLPSTAVSFSLVCVLVVLRAPNLMVPRYESQEVSFRPSLQRWSDGAFPVPSASQLYFCIFNLSFCFFSAFFLDSALTVLHRAVSASQQGRKDLSWLPEHHRHPPQVTRSSPSFFSFSVEFDFGHIRDPEPELLLVP